MINVKQFLCSELWMYVLTNLLIECAEYWGYKEHDIVTLTDDAPNPRQKPTKQNIVGLCFWFFFYAQILTKLL